MPPTSFTVTEFVTSNHSAAPKSKFLISVDVTGGGVGGPESEQPTNTTASTGRPRQRSDGTWLSIAKGQ